MNDLISRSTYRWHNHLTLESSSDTIVNTLGLSPACVDAFVGVALMPVETLRACKIQESISIIQHISSRTPDVIFASVIFKVLQRENSRSLFGEVERTLLDDRDVLLCGNHLQSC